MPASTTIIELEALALSWAEASPYPSGSKRSLSALISEDIEAQKHGPRTLVDVASLKAHYAGLAKETDHAPFVCSAAALMRCRICACAIAALTRR